MRFRSSDCTNASRPASRSILSLTPALFTSPSSWPSLSSVSATARAHAASFIRSSWMKRMRGWRSLILLRNAESRGVRPRITGTAPSCASSIEIAPPMPAPPPVTMTTRPASFRSMRCYHCAGGKNHAFCRRKRRRGIEKIACDFFPLIKTCREGFFRRCHREDRLLGDDAFRHRLTRDDILHRRHELRPEQRIALDGHVELARQHRFEGAPHAVDRNDEDFLPGLEPRLFDRLDRADRHVIVVREEHVDAPPLRLEERLHHFLTLRAREIAGLRANDLVARIGRDDFLESLLPIVRRRRAHRALQLDDADVT